MSAAEGGGGGEPQGKGGGGTGTATPAKMAEIGKEGGGGKGRALAKLNYIREGARKRAEKLAIVTPR